MKNLDSFKWLYFTKLKVKKSVTKYGTCYILTDTALPQILLSPHSLLIHLQIREAWAESIVQNPRLNMALTYKPQKIYNKMLTEEM